MEEAFTRSTSDALAQLEACMKSFRKNCAHCSSSRRGDSHPTCLVDISSSIIDLASLLGAVKFDSDIKLRPTSMGLWAFAKYRNGGANYPTNAFHQISSFLFHNGINGAKGIKTMLRKIAYLFTGYGHANDISVDFSLMEDPAARPQKTQTAIGVYGICVFLEGLVSASPRAEQLRHIHVIPGHIAKVGRGQANIATHYETVSDLGETMCGIRDLTIVRASRPEPLGVPEHRTDEVVDKPSSNPLQDASAGVARDIKISAEVIDSSTGKDLTYFYRVQEKDNYALVSPGWLTQIVLRTTGLIECRRGLCSTEWPETVNLFQVKSGWWPHAKKSEVDQQYPGKLGACIDWSHITKTDAARLLALASCRSKCFPDFSPSTQGQVALRRDECLPCCLRYASRRFSKLRAPYGNAGDVITHPLYLHLI
ncbi:hypothetical protein BU24DRAFT_214810 [Aaosphaeria arxii CBS 175.79]|uniref:Uncharacterized protein n=1 Tax=Aaosphaeria arxii CBS 175.79 TaxID=1450172 RepID=A0A6A5XNJ6_9PLEO|nr:uncharacterized protein BU24DRAFT_214810 [Aaosphaeria arxii CBS 175.79]KAF2014469.1 hypothetical protein BU24DRAFT_214810 [Aaosphaeria arxii CBS 175.79]